MQILADESCDFRIVQDLRTHGIEIDSVLEQDQGATDHAVIQAAIEDRKILLTEDRDFGRQVFVEGRSQTGVILLRYPHKTYAQISERTAERIERESEEKLMASFVVVQPGKTRFRKLP